MTIIYHANKVQETATTTGIGNFILAGATTGYKTFLGAIGENKRFTYHIYRQDTNFEWEIGIGYVSYSGGVTQLIRERVVSSTNNNNLVGFTSGTKYIETIVGQTSVNTSFINVEEKSSNFIAPYSPATYIIDASVSGVQVTLPGVVSQADPIIMGFMLDKTIGGAYEQANAITLVPSGTETINGLSSESVTILKDYLQIISVPSQTGWLLLDPIQDSTNPYGNDGAIQFKYDGAFSGVNNLSWNSTNNALLVGGTGNLITADIILPASGQTTVFNEQSLDKDFRIEGSGTTHLVFVDASTNRVGINNSNPLDMLDINSNNNNGLTIYKSGVGPQITIGNTTNSGLATNDTIGSIVFSGLNSANSSVTYGKIYCLVENPTSSSELSSINVEIVNNGSNEDVAVFSPSGITLGFNNQNIDGIIIGNASDNEGNNISLGYYNTLCGSNSIIIGNSTSLASGTFGGAIGYDHAVSGTNVWVVGGSGVSATGSNRVYLALNNNNHLSIVNSGSLAYTTLSNQDTTFSLVNNAILSSGLKEQISYNFVNSAGLPRSGVVVGMDVLVPSSGSEKTQFFANVLNGSSGVRILSLDKDSVVIGNNSYSGNNIIYGTNNTISNSGNRVIGSNISGTGTNNNILGDNISYSGNNISVFGNNNLCQNSGNLGVVIFGNSNIANEDYATIVGTSNSASGLYSVSCGYLNGTHGDYSVSVGEGNIVLSNGSIAVGNTNNLAGTSLDASIFAVGIGNMANISATGYLLGHNNQMYGSGSLLVGNNSYVSGTNNIVIGNSISFTGSNTLLLSNSGTVQISGTSGSIIHNAMLTAKNNSLSVTDTGIYISSSGLTRISGVSSVENYAPSLLYQANNSNKISITSSGTTINGSGHLTLGYGLSDTIVLSSGGVSISGSPAQLQNNGNSVIVTSSGASITNGNSFAKASISGIEISSPDYININSTGIIDIAYSGNSKIRVADTGSYLRHDNLASIICNSINYIDLYPTGINIVSGSGNLNNVITGANYNTIVDGFTKFEVSNSGAKVFGYDPFFIATYPIVDFRQYSSNWGVGPAYTEIVFYKNAGGYGYQNSAFAIMHSGRFGIENLQPNHTLDITGDFRLNNTGSGIIYQSAPAATGYASPLVIEDNVIRSSSGTSISLTPPTATGITSPLVIEDNIVKLAGPSGISLPNNYETATGLGTPLVIEDGITKSAIVGSNGLQLRTIPMGASPTGVLTVTDAKIQFIDVHSSITTYNLLLSQSGVPNGKEFFIVNSNIDNEIIIGDQSYPGSIVAVLGGTGVLGTGNKSCHVGFMTDIPGMVPQIWTRISYSKQ